MSEIGNTVVGKRPTLTYEHVLIAGKVVQVFKNMGRISDAIYWESVAKINAIAEAVCVENDIVLFKGEQFRKIPRNTPLGERSFDQLQELSRWLLKQHPKFRENFRSV